MTFDRLHPRRWIARHVLLLFVFQVFGTLPDRFLCNLASPRSVSFKIHIISLLYLISILVAWVYTLPDPYIARLKSPFRSDLCSFNLALALFHPHVESCSWFLLA